MGGVGSKRIYVFCHVDWSICQRLSFNGTFRTCAFVQVSFIILYNNDICK